MNTNLKLSVTVALAALLHTGVHASVAVAFDAAQHVQATSTAAPGNFALDTVTPTRAVTENVYSGPAVYGGLNEGAAASWSVTTAAFSGLRLRMEPGAGDDASALFLFKTGAVRFTTANDTFSSDAVGVNPGQLSTREIRYVVEDAGAFYISAASNLALVNSADALDLSWFSYNPSTVAGVTTIGAVASPTFQDIDFIGFRLRAVRSLTNLATSIGVTDFSVTAVPEPAAFALIAGAIAGVMASRRRRRA